jgi:hypothetical protein
VSIQVFPQGRNEVDGEPLVQLDPRARVHNEQWIHARRA